MWIRIDQHNLINPDPDPDPGRIQVNKITKFPKHLLIFKSQKNFIFSSHSEPIFLCSRLEKYNFVRKKKFLLVKLCFSLHFIGDFVPLDPDPDPHH